MLIESIVNSEVSSVIFIRDYIQITLEDEEKTSILTTYRLPIVAINKVIYNSETLGYRDALCSLINMSVKGISIADKQSINLFFDGDREIVLSVSLNENDDLPEIAMLASGKEITVW